MRSPRLFDGPHSSSLAVQAIVMSRTGLFNLRFIERRTLWRVVWSVVLLMHLPATVGVFSTILRGAGDDATWALAFQLGLSSLFFLFEIIFASTSKWLANRRCAIAFALVILLLHVGAIDRLQTEFVTDASLQNWIALSMAAAVAWLIGLTASAFSRAAKRYPGVAQRQSARHLYTMLSESTLILRQPVSSWQAAPLRAPPRR